MKCIPDEYKNEKRIWLHLAFAIRACVLPINEYRVVEENQVEAACNKFYNLYEKCYGPINCTYSIHVVASHLPKIKGNRPLTHKSAFKFESFFAEMRQLFHPGTTSAP